MNYSLYKNKFPILLLFVFSVFFANNLHAQTNGLGLGLAFGEPTGICFKKWVDDEHAITGTVAYSIISQSYFWSFNGSYTLNKFKTIGYKNKVGFQYGIGFRVSTRDNLRTLLGLRSSASVVWYPNFLPIDFYFEFAPVLFVYPYPGLGLDAGAGIRYYFKYFQD